MEAVTTTTTTTIDPGLYMVDSGDYISDADCSRYTYPYTHNSYINAQGISFSSLRPTSPTNYQAVEYFEILDYIKPNSDHIVVRNDVEIQIGDKIYNNGTINFVGGSFQQRDLTRPTASIERIAIVEIRAKFYGTPILSNSCTWEFSIICAF